MKKSTKIISLILAVIMIFSVVPTAFASPVKNVENEDAPIEALISNNSLANLVDYLVTKINDNKNDITGTVLRIVLLALKDNESLQPFIDGKDVSKFSDEESAAVIVNWINAILKDKTKEISENQIVKIINLIPSLTVDLSSVDGVYATLGMADKLAVRAIINELGDLKDLNVSAVKGKTVKSNGNLGMIKAAIQFVKDNLGIVKKFVMGTLQFGNYKIPLIGTNISGMLNDAVKDYIDAMKELPDFIKSFLYKLINSDAATGEFEKGKMGGDWAKSAYSGHNADQLLAAALLHLIKGDDSVISKDEANDVLALSVYGMIGAYAEPVFNKFLLAPINGALEGMNNWLADEGTNANLKTLFKASIPQIDTSTYKTIFDNAKTTGLLEQLNNILVAVLKTLLADDVYSALKLVNGNNSKLNANLTKIARYFVNFVKAHEDVAAELQIPAEVLNADVSKLTLADMAFIALKPFFGTWFKDHTPEYSDAAVASADSNADLALLAVYYVATSEWLNLGKDGAFDFAPLKAKIFYKGKLRNLTNEKATDLIVETAADMGIGAIQYNADKIYFNETLDTTDWQGALNTIENWALNFVSGLPAVVKAHDLTNQNGYGPFYKLNVLLNELINFAFLNNANDGKSFTLDLEYLLKNALLGKVFDFDLAGIIGIFEQSKNKNEGNILNGQLNTTVIGMVDRIITALFEHSHNNTTKEYNRKPATGKNYCTKDTLTLYSYCDPCGAYTAAPEAQTVTTTATGKTINRHTKGAAATCTTAQKCKTCGAVLKKALGHKYTNVITKATLTKDGKSVPTCSVCGAKKTATVIKKASKVTISKTKFVYNGKVQKPTLSVKNSAGKAIATKNYTAAWKNKSSKAVGTYTVTVTFKGNYSGKKTLTYTIVPKAVTGVKKAAATTKSIKLSWTKVVGAKYYEVYGSTDGKTFKKISTVTANSLNVTKVNGKALAAGKTYYFKVRALDATKKLIGAYSAVLKTGTLTAAPKLTKLTSTKSKTATATWRKVTGAKSYVVYKSTDGKKWTKAGTTAKTTLTLTKLTAGKPIFVKVVAVNAFKGNSAASAVKKVTVKK